MNLMNHNKNYSFNSWNLVNYMKFKRIFMRKARIGRLFRFKEMQCQPKEREGLHLQVDFKHIICILVRLKQSRTIHLLCSHQKRCSCRMLVLKRKLICQALTCKAMLRSRSRLITKKELNSLKN